MKTPKTCRRGGAPCSIKRVRKGAAVVEFAVVAPVLILVLLGMIECGRMIMVQQALTTAVREGARVASLDGATTTSAADAVHEFLAGAGIKGGSVTTSNSKLGWVGHGQPITVTVTVPFSKVSWLPSPLFLKSATLTSSATMRRETPN